MQEMFFIATLRLSTSLLMNVSTTSSFTFVDSGIIKQIIFVLALFMLSLLFQSLLSVNLFLNGFVIMYLYAVLF